LIPPSASPVQVEDTTAWYRPGVSVSDFHRSRVRTRVLLGGRGCGKTTAIAVETIGHCWHNAGGKVYILRKTQDSNEDTTLETFEIVFGLCGSAYQDTGLSLFKKVDGGKMFRLPSRIAVQLFNEFHQAHPKATKQQINRWLENVGNRYCSWVCFAGVPSGQYRATRFRGYECSMLIFVEADQLDKEDLDLGVACLRWKGADPAVCTEKGFIKDTCVILDSNPPGTQHWIAKLEEETIQSGDLTTKFWHVATEENRDNLPPGYIEGLKRQYRKNPAMYKRMLLGQYADAFDGEPVFYAFTLEHMRPTLPWPKGAYLIRGWDFGTKNATVWSAYWSDGQDEYWWDLLEYYAEQSDTDRQCEAVKRLTQEVFPFWNDRDVCSGIRDYCDPAGRAKKDTGSSLKVLHTYEFYPGWTIMGLPQSIAIYNRLLEKKDRFGHSIYLIDEKACPRLCVASQGGYRYPKVGEPGYGSDEPLKGDEGGEYDHVCDASRYAKINCLRLIRKEVEAAQSAIGRFAAKTAVNVKKRYY
jgi:hypothetical protein